MRDRIIQIIIALTGMGFCATGIKVAWWLVARMLEGIAEGNLAMIIGTGLLMYLGGSIVVVILLGIGTGLLVLATDY